MKSPLQNHASYPSDRRQAAGLKPRSGPATEPTSCSAEDTLRLLANLPAPEGLVERVQISLRTAPRTASVLQWPVALRPADGWMHGAAMRGAAAAAIVCVVAGGGWSIYSRVPPYAPPAAKAITMPARVGSSGGFSSAGAMRKPETLNGPVLTHSVKASNQQSDAVTAPTPTSQKNPSRTKADKAKKNSAPAAMPPAR